MAAPNITLDPNTILVTLTSSSSGIVITTGDYNFGLVAKIADAMDAFTVGQTVSFKINDAVEMIYGSTIYYLVDVSETKVIFKETVPL